MSWIYHMKPAIPDQKQGQLAKIVSTKIYQKNRKDIKQNIAKNIPKAD